MTTMLAAEPAVDVAVVEVRPRAVVSWSSILAGALTALALTVVLTVTALAAGLEVAPIRGTVVTATVWIADDLQLCQPSEPRRHPIVDRGTIPTIRPLPISASTPMEAPP